VFVADTTGASSHSTRQQVGMSNLRNADAEDSQSVMVANGKAEKTTEVASSTAVGCTNEGIELDASRFET
jgi:hypothetical protein